MRALLVTSLVAGVALAAPGGRRGLPERLRIFVAQGDPVALPTASPPPFSVVVLPAGLRGMMSAVWIQNNRHWDELAGQNTLTQLLGTGKPTQREYLGCLAGEIVNDTLWVRELLSAPT